jgi:phage gp29-like protein
MIRKDIHYSDMLRVQDLINKLLLIDYRINVQPNAEIVPYSFEWVYEENQDYESNARIIEIVSRTGLPLNVAKDKLYNILGLPMPNEADTDLIELKNSQTGIVI